MTWNIRKRHRELLEDEMGIPPTVRGGSVRVCLIYPEIYRTGMSSLGFLHVYRLINETRGACCERAFLPEPSEIAEYRERGSHLVSVETGTPLADFDMLAFSVSFEPDYVNIPLILSLSRIPHFAGDRSSGHPLIIGGGAAFRINPLPAAPFMDIVCTGEAELLLADLFGLLEKCGMSRQTIKEKARLLPGAYVHSGSTASGTVPPEPHPSAMLRKPASSVLVTKHAEFSSMFLMEVTRGCARGCRFCASGFAFGSFRQYPLEQLVETAESGLAITKRIGLVGAAVSDHRDIAVLCRHILSRGGSVSLSSLRIDRMDETMLDILAESGQKTIALAPEGPSARLRNLVRKNITEAQILDACERAAARGILNLKLYYLIGLPGETDDDLLEMLETVQALKAKVTGAARKRGRLGEILLSVNPFIPKPCTPLQWCPMPPLKELKRKLSFLDRKIRAIPNVRFKCERPEESLIQAYISRSDDSAAQLMSRAALEGRPFRSALKSAGINPAESASRCLPTGDPLPWDRFCTCDKELLIREYREACALIKLKESLL